MKFDPNHPSIKGPCLRVYIHKSGREWIPIADILSLEGEKGYTWLNWTHGRRVSLPYSLKQIQHLLPATHFLRVHRHYLLNRQFIERINHEVDGSYVSMTIGPKIPISRRRLPFVEQELNP
ncbi:MAG: LytTR family transcriptional regulator [Pedobacter sp.]|nr:MAG: LytTR family transcriptional regulator [Pedobacter sp.]